MSRFFLNMIIKGKNGSTLQDGTVFQNGSRVEQFWLHFFSQCSMSEKAQKAVDTNDAQFRATPDSDSSFHAKSLSNSDSSEFSQQKWNHFEKWNHATYMYVPI